LVAEIQKANTEDEVFEIGTDWCIEQSKGLIKAGAPVIHYYTMSNVKASLKVLKGVF
jgi:methylenetetrahydrofolate reductase (NADPH)